ncbi:hypothetical protein AC578_1207 [Pseudocercospora eumusae]|uniref:Uncharacterized protein n=1 Tax=Pseudocercospora eumusae TaxID=321146 RepID=A0A139HCZ5_9PEZI|nr:hypothetical protein AC578_1207 [Pseudocercospora eumusae]
MPFELATKYSHHHLIVQPKDLALEPPESYLFIQDGLIISCGVLYSLCYLFYMLRTVKDKTLSGYVEFLCGTMAYEVYYAFTTTSTTFEKLSFLVWFLLDATFAAVAVLSAYKPERRALVTARLVAGVVIGVIFLHALCQYFPDERQQLTAYWTGLLLQLPIGWGSVILMLSRGDTKGHSMEIWVTRFLGCVTAYGVFYWRYFNAPDNWPYVGSIWSTLIIVLTMLPEFAYPVICMYLRVLKGQKGKVE